MSLPICPLSDPMARRSTTRFSRSKCLGIRRRFPAMPKMVISSQTPRRRLPTQRTLRSPAAPRIPRSPAIRKSRVRPETPSIRRRPEALVSLVVPMSPTSLVSTSMRPTVSRRFRRPCRKPATPRCSSWRALPAPESCLRPWVQSSASAARNTFAACHWGMSPMARVGARRKAGSVTKGPDPYGAGAVRVQWHEQNGGRARRIAAR